MVSLNKCEFIGNLGKEPEMRFTPSGSPVTTFSVAVNRKYKGPDGDMKEETEWVSVVAWNKLAETCNQYLNKGQMVYLEGRLHTRSWEDKSGAKRYTTEIIGETMQLGPRGSAAPAPQGGKSFPSAPKKEMEEDEDIPIIEDGDEIDVKDIPF